MISVPYASSVLRKLGQRSRESFWSLFVELFQCLGCPSLDRVTRLRRGSSFWLRGWLCCELYPRGVLVNHKWHQRANRTNNDPTHEFPPLDSPLPELRPLDPQPDSPHLITHLSSRHLVQHLSSRQFIHHYLNSRHFIHHLRNSRRLINHRLLSRKRHCNRE